MTFTEGDANLPTVLRYIPTIPRATAFVLALVCEPWPLYVMQSTKIFTFYTIQYTVDFDYTNGPNFHVPPNSLSTTVSLSTFITSICH